MKRDKQILLLLTADELQEIDAALQSAREEKKDVTISRNEFVRSLIKQSLNK